jgi:DNA-binding HxlR family transcriptional regulator
MRITPLAKTLVPALRNLASRSERHLNEVRAGQRRYDAGHDGPA